MSSDIPSPPTRSRIGVLVADGERSVCQMLEVGLRSAGFLVWAAEDGQEALDLFRQHRD